MVSHNKSTVRPTEPKSIVARDLFRGFFRFPKQIYGPSETKSNNNCILVICYL
jgi:hypothetical protein